MHVWSRYLLFNTPFIDIQGICIPAFIDWSLSQGVADYSYTLTILLWLQTISNKRNVVTKSVEQARNRFGDFEPVGLSFKGVKLFDELGQSLCALRQIDISFQ